MSLELLTQQLLWIVSIVAVVALIWISYVLYRISRILDHFLEEYRREQEAREKLLLRATADILEAVKERNRGDAKKS
jgi:hypothetical protein